MLFLKHCQLRNQPRSKKTEAVENIFHSKLSRKPNASRLWNSKWCGAPGPPVPVSIIGTASARKPFLTVKTSLLKKVDAK